jgi:hypothetical protein
VWQRTSAEQSPAGAALVSSVGSNALSRASRDSPLILDSPPREIEIWTTSGRPLNYPVPSSACPNRCCKQAQAGAGQEDNMAGNFAGRQGSRRPRLRSIP